MQKVLLIKRVMVFGLMLLSCLAAVNIVYAQNIERDLQALDLSLSQRGEILSIQQKYQQSKQKIAAELEQKRQLERQLLGSTDTQNQALADVQNQIQKLQIKIADIEVEYLRDVKQILTPEQREKLKSLQFAK